MDLKITNGFYDPSHLSYEVVERKGLGHPDTLADGIAEQIEIDYSLYCLDKFGVIPHHNFDKIIIRGGHSVQDFGGSDFIEPIKIIFLGRASKKCFNSPIPLFKIQKKAATKYLNRILPNLDVENYVEFETLTSDFTTKTNWFSPEAIEDLPEYLDVPKANDTATMISYWPLTISEELALMIEGYFYKLDKNELPTPRFTKMGGDIKVMVVRNDLEYSIRINFPLISKFFNNDIESQLYVDKHVEKIKKYIEQKYKNIRVIMFVIGIPTLNEADNISRLVKQIDEYAVNLGKEIIIINSDSKSTDGTPQIFLETKTYNTKVSIVSEAKGKGYNVRNIFEYAINHVPNFSGLILIDGDVVSMKKMWLEKMFIAIESGNDLIIPNYARKSFEGNATNHFIYPMLVKFFKRDMPYQCISGDFGFSRGLIKDLTLKCNWHKYTLGYGIDIFLTLTAILKSYKIKEIDLQSKIHKKSFEKIEKIFLEVSQSFFETINDNSLNQDKLRLNINFESHSRQFIKSSDILSSNDIENLKLRALFLLQEEKQYPHGLSEVEWDGILSNTINNIYRYSSEEHSLYLLPLYLLRVYNYLKYN